MKKELLSKGPELLADLGDHTASILREMTDLKEPLAYNIAIELVNKMRHIWGGQLIYFPKGASMEIAERDLQMYADFNGRNHADLVRKYGVSLVQVYNILRRVKATQMGKFQPDMFDAEE